MVKIAKALSLQSPKVLIMDEPYISTLTQKRNRHFICFNEKIKNPGVAIIFISHRLEEVKAIADRITILRDGEKVYAVEERKIEPLKRLPNLMVGKLDSIFPKKNKNYFKN